MVALGGETDFSLQHFRWNDATVVVYEGANQRFATACKKAGLECSGFLLLSKTAS
jgi:hypothetical protein